MSSKGKVLVIDDDPDFVEFVRIILETNGYDVSCAYNANHGLELLRTGHPDIVLLDIMMSYTMAGLEVTRTMHQDLELSTIPLIVISSVLPGAFLMILERYRPRPSWVMPRTTFTPVLGTLVNL